MVLGDLSMRKKYVYIQLVFTFILVKNVDSNIVNKIAFVLLQAKFVICSHYPLMMHLKLIDS